MDFDLFFKKPRFDVRDSGEFLCKLVPYWAGVRTNLTGNTFTLTSDRVAFRCENTLDVVA